MTTINHIYEEIFKYAQNELPTVKERNSLVDSIFEKLDTDKDGKLSEKDGMNDFYKEAFGLDTKTFLTKEQLKNEIGNIAYEMSFIDDSELPDSDFSSAYVTPEEAEKIKELGAANGATVYRLINGDTPDHNYTTVNKILEKINKNNVVDFIQGFNVANGASPEGLLEYLDDEHDSVNPIKMENKKNIITSLLEVAKEKGLEQDGAYIELQTILVMYNSDGAFAGQEKFNQKMNSNWENICKYSASGAASCGTIGGFLGAGFFSWATATTGAIIGGIGGAITGFFDHNTYNERIDELMNSLCKKINNAN